MDPHNPEQAGSVGVQHDDRPDKSHEEEANKAGNGGESVKEEDAKE